MTRHTRARLGGLGKVIAVGSAGMADMGRLGATALDRRIAAEAGIPEDAPDYASRLAAARSAYYIRLAEGRWSREHGGRKAAAG
jgi:hypothetical protein